MRTQRRLRVGDARAGSALAAALMVVIGVSVLGTCLLQLHISVTRQQIQGIDNKRAFYLAEAGLSEGVFSLSTGGTGAVASAAQPAAFGDGLFWVESTYLENDQTQLTSTGLCGGGRAALTLVVEKKSSSVAELGIFGDTSMQIQTGALVDAYDSTVGPYVAPTLIGGVLGTSGLTTPPPPVHVGCNGDIRVSATTRAPTNVCGDAMPGPSNSVVTTPGVTITGATAPAPQTVTIPTIEVPVLDSRGDLSVGALAPAMPDGDVRYGKVHVSSLGKLVLRGPKKVVFSELVVDGGGGIKFDTSNGPVTLYVTDYVKTSASSTVECSSTTPSQCSVLVAASQSIDRDGDGVVDPPLTIASTGNYYGTLYAPFTALTVPASLQLFGALAAKDILIGERGKVHFDAGLLSSGAGQLSLPRRVAWRVVPLPSQPLVNLRVDPVATLKKLGLAPVMPATSHELLDFKIDYRGLDLKRHYWEGSESRFHWPDVVLAFKIRRIGDCDFLLTL
jgi:Tfp pilus assembly protein PilX